MSRPWRKPRVVPDDDDQKYRAFLGLVNTQSEKDIGLGALAIANNVLGTDGKKIVTRPGYSLFRAGTVATAYVLGDSLYIVESGALKRLLPDGSTATLASGFLNSSSYSWDKINGKAYFVNGVDAGVVVGGNYEPLRVYSPRDLHVTPGGTSLPPVVYNFGEQYAAATWRFCATYETADGRESAPSDLVEVSASPAEVLFTATVSPLYARTNIYVTEPDGTVLRLGASGNGSFTIAARRATRELATMGAFPLPEGVELIQYWNGRLWASQYDSISDTSVIWSSRPFAFHLFDMGEDFVSVPGRVALLLANNAGLLIGTTDYIYQYTAEGKLDTLVDYGVVPGLAGDLDAEGMAYFWTVRGFCKAMPFENMTEKLVSMAPGLLAYTTLVYLDGAQQLITLTQGGGTPFNARS